MELKSVGYWTVKVANKYMILVAGEVTQKIPLPVTANTVRLEDSLGTKICYRSPENYLEVFSSVSILAIFDPRFDELKLVEPTPSEWLEFLISAVSDHESIQQAKNILAILKNRLAAQLEVLNKIKDNLPKNGIVKQSANVLKTINWKGSIMEVWRAYDKAYPDKSLSIQEKTPEMIKSWLKSWLTSYSRPENTTRTTEKSEVKEND